MNRSNSHRLDYHRHGKALNLFEVRDFADQFQEPIR
jgi:hypothetical protein